MQNAAGGGIAIEPKDRDKDRDDAYRTVVSDLVALIDHVQASLTLIETAIAREMSVGSPETSANVFVLDDVTPPYVRATAALQACDTSLAIALHSLLDSKAPTHGNCGYAKGARTLSIVNG